MSKFTDLNEKIDTPIKTWGIILSVATATYATCFQFLQKFVPPEYLNLTKWLISYLILLAAINVICYYIRGTKEQKSLNFVDGVKTFETFFFKDNYRKIAGWMQAISYTGILIFSFLFIKASQKEINSCKEAAKQFTITINKFSIEPQDAFSNNLANFLSMHKVRNSSVDLTGRFFVGKTSTAIEDSLVALLGCHKSGLVVYGNYDELAKSFYCNLFLHHMTGKCETVSVGDTIIPLQDPTFIEMKTTNLRVQLIGKFIQSLCLSFYCQEKRSNLLLNELIKSPKNEECPDLLAYCYLIKGNNQARMHQIDSAIQSYSSGLRYDPDDSLLLVNLKKLSKVLKTQLSVKQIVSPKLNSVSDLNLKENTRPPEKRSSAIFTIGKMKITYTKELINAELSYLLKLTVKGKTFSFRGDQDRLLRNDTTFRHSDSFELQLENNISDSLTKDDFRKAQCDLFIFRNGQSDPEIHSKIETIIILSFTDKKGLIFNNTNINFH